jgi:hypothetical protein
MNPIYRKMVVDCKLLKPMKLVCLKGKGDYDGTSSNGSSSFPTLSYVFLPLVQQLISQTKINHTAHDLLHRRSRRLLANMV